MAEEFLGYYKVGDKQTAPGKEYRGLKHGAPFQYVLASEWNKKDLRKLTGVRDKIAFAVVRHPISLLPAFKRWTQPIGLNADGMTIPDKNIYRPTQRIMDFDILQAKSGVPDLHDKLKAANYSVDLINGLDISELDMIDASTIPNRFTVEDVNLITGGSFTIGAGGLKDYLTIATYVVDWGSPITVNLLGTLQTPITETGGAGMLETINTGITSRITSDADHLGDPSDTSRLISLNYNTQYFTMSHEGQTATAKLEIDHLYTKRLVAAGASYDYINTGNATPSDIYIHDVMCDCDDKGVIGIFPADNTCRVFVYNAIVWGATLSGVHVNVGMNAASIIESVSLYASETNLNINNLAGTYRNVLGLSGNTADYANVGNGTGRNTASTDANNENGDWNVGTGNISNLTAADEVESLLDSSSNFMLPKATGNLKAGSNFAIPGHTDYINKVGYTPGQAYIGAKGLAIAAGSPIIPVLMTNAMRDAIG